MTLQRRLMEREEEKEADRLAMEKLSRQEVLEVERDEELEKQARSEVMSKIGPVRCARNRSGQKLCHVLVRLEIDMSQYRPGQRSDQK